MSVLVQACAPSNIALVKYMGKREGNIPENPSLSLTLDALHTVVGVKRGVAIAGRTLQCAGLDSVALERAVRHFERVHESVSEHWPSFGLEAVTSGQFLMESHNTFPASSGIASSASSFAAMTLAFLAVLTRDPGSFKTQWNASIGAPDSANRELRRLAARLARQGSGSASRSFDGPWVFWEGEDAQPLKSHLEEVAHFVILVSRAKKAVSSSEAHSRVKSSPLWLGRSERASKRASDIRAALLSGQWNTIAIEVWREMWEMHSLFHTSVEPFSFWEPGSLEVLKEFMPLFAQGAGGERERRENARLPMVTMDAGPNVHVIVPRVEKSMWQEKLRCTFPKYEISKDGQGQGACLLEVSSVPEGR
ncbi:hypothetical protein WDW86_11225 [Bdellovibrionota bacterium FG-2]